MTEDTDFGRALIASLQEAVAIVRGEKDAAQVHRPRGDIVVPIDADTARAARVFMQRLRGRYTVIEGILFGSRARGTHTADSDADIAVVLEGAKGNRNAIGGDMAGIAFDVLMETGVLVEALPLWVDEFKLPDGFSNPALIRNIQRDGVRL